MSKSIAGDENAEDRHKKEDVRQRTPMLLIWHQPTPDASDPWETDRQPHTHIPDQPQTYSKKACLWSRCKCSQCMRTLATTASPSQMFLLRLLTCRP